MDTVYLLQHIHVLPSAEEDVKILGIYRTRELALAAVERLWSQPGFRDFPNIVDPEATEENDGFYIAAYRLDKDHWSEGFITV
jgi:hypothetical protein